MINTRHIDILNIHYFLNSWLLKWDSRLDYSTVEETMDMQNDNMICWFCILDNNFIHLLHCNFNSIVYTWWDTAKYARQ